MLSQGPDPSGPREAKDAGFAILETLVALAVLAIALGVLLAVLTDGIRRQGRAERLAEATLHAQSLLARVGADVPLKAGTTTGTLPNGMHWQVLVERYGDAADRKAWPVSAYRVLVDVNSGDGEPSGPLLRLSTLRLAAEEPSR
jgi:general secretion pathway protein I